MKLINEGMETITASLGVTTAALSLFSADITMSIFNVPAYAVVAAAMGALAGFAYGEPIAPRRKLFYTAFANTVLGAAVAGILPQYLSFTWWMPNHAAPLALVVGFLSRWLVPAIVENIKPFFANLNPFRKDKKP